MFAVQDSLSIIKTFVRFELLPFEMLSMARAAVLLCLDQVAYFQTQDRTTWANELVAANTPYPNEREFLAEVRCISATITRPFVADKATSCLQRFKSRVVY